MNFVTPLFYMVLLSMSWSVVISDSQFHNFLSSKRFTFAKARCSAKCISEYGIPSTNSTSSTSFIPTCHRKNERCNMCLRVCVDKPILGQRFSCEKTCAFAAIELYDVCFDSCIFITEITNIGQKSGTCPLNASSTTMELVHHECTNDWECFVDEKCCVYKRKHSCHGAVYERNEKDSLLISVSNLKMTSCMLSWHFQNNNQRDGVQFVIEKRYSSSAKRTTPAKEFSLWESVDQTPKFQYRLRNLRYDRYYQFRIAVVNKSGHHGYTMTTTMKLPMNFQPPSSPSQFMVRNSSLRLSQDDVVVSLSWKPPSFKEGTITMYEIEYFKSIDKKNHSAFSMLNTITVPGDQHSVTLLHLLPNSLYEAVIVAIASLENVDIRSKPKKIFFTTLQVKILPVQENLTTSLAPLSTKSLRTAMHAGILAYINRVEKTDSHVDVLIKWEKQNTKVNAIKISWQEKHCKEKTTKQVGSNFHFVRAESLKYTLRKLKRYCRYHIKLESYYHHGIKADSMSLHLDTAFDKYFMGSPSTAGCNTYNIWMLGVCLNFIIFISSSPSLLDDMTPL